MVDVKLKNLESLRQIYGERCEIEHSADPEMIQLYQIASNSQQ